MGHFHLFFFGPCDHETETEALEMKLWRLKFIRLGIAKLLSAGLMPKPSRKFEGVDRRSRSATSTKGEGEASRHDAQCLGLLKCALMI
jgi:hypothetical protein